MMTEDTSPACSIRKAVLPAWPQGCWPDQVMRVHLLLLCGPTGRLCRSVPGRVHPPQALRASFPF